MDYNCHSSNNSQLCSQYPYSNDLFLYIFIYTYIVQVFVVIPTCSFTSLNIILYVDRSFVSSWRETTNSDEFTIFCSNYNHSFIKIHEWNWYMFHLICHFWWPLVDILSVGIHFTHYSCGLTDHGWLNIIHKIIQKVLVCHKQDIVYIQVMFKLD